jgi:plastocyanin
MPRRTRGGISHALSIQAAVVLVLGSLNSVWAGDLVGTVVSSRGPVREAVLFIEGLQTPPVHERVTMDQRDRTFIPHVMAVQVGTRVEFPNNDTVFHNVFSTREGKPFDLGLYAVGKMKPRAFYQPGLIRIFCNIHTNMSAFIWVVENPYFKVTDRLGRFRISGVPAGRHVVRVWHERRGTRRVTITVPAEGTVPLEVRLGS